MIDEYIKKYTYHQDGKNTRRFSEKEIAFIRQRYTMLVNSKDIEFVNGSPDTSLPNEILVRYKGNERAVPFSILIRLCPCTTCVHPDKSQYWCFMEDCTCCRNSCT